MVSSIGYKLAQNRLVTGFGMRRRTTCGRGVRKVVSNITRPALTYIANKIADVISGEGRVHRRTVRGASYKLTGGAKRRPRKTLTHRRHTVGGAVHKRRTATTRRRPRRTLETGRVMHRRRIMF